MPTDFPKAGEDQAVTLRNSAYPQFDYAYALALRDEFPDIWNNGGMERGTSAFTNWGKARDGDMTEAVVAWIKEREAWAARHYGNNRLAGVVAQIKWGVIGTLGEGGMKELVNDAKARARKGKTFTAKVKASTSGDGLYTFVGSTPRVDRAGETVAASWDLESYKRNPVVLYQHQHDGLPIGRAEDVFLDGEQLMFRVRFVPKEIYPFADTVRQMYEAGFMNAVSVGFRPLDVKGADIRHSELLELSAVAIPANADALLEGKSNVRPVYRDDVTPRDLAEADAVKLKAWFSTTKEATVNETTTESVATTEAPEAAVEAALAEGVETKSLAELKGLIAQAIEAHRSGEMDAASAALEAAAAMVDVLMSEDEGEGTEVEIEVPAMDSIAQPDEQKDANAETLATLTKQVAELAARMDAMAKPTTTKAHDEDPFASQEALGRFIAKQLGGI
jgi:hypothetical protein